MFFVFVFYKHVAPLELNRNPYFSDSPEERDNHILSRRAHATALRSCFS